jgi:epidermal growth factor receptor substrate 15
MGFSRSQAVIALEKHGYDVQKALNSLVGTQ